MANETEAVDTPTQRVAALSADLRSLIQENTVNDYGDSEAEAALALELCDAIDAMFSAQEGSGS